MPAKRGLDGDERGGGEARGVAREGAREESGHEDEAGEHERHRRPAGARLVDLHRGLLAREGGAGKHLHQDGVLEVRDHAGPVAPLAGGREVRGLVRGRPEGKARAFGAQEGEEDDGGESRREPRARHSADYAWTPGASWPVRATHST